jgi:hypothetical protein
MKHMAAARSRPQSPPANKKFFVSQTDRVKRSFNDVIVHLRNSVLAIVIQRLPLIEHLVDCLGRVGLERERH